MIRLSLIVAAAMLTAGGGLGIAQWVLGSMDSVQQESDYVAAAPFISASITGEVIPPPPGPRSEERARLRKEHCTAAHLPPRSHPPFSALVVQVADGESFIATSHGLDLRIGLWGIHAPETGQPGGPEARNRLEQLIPPGRRVMVHPVQSDRSGNVVATVGPEDDWAANVLIVAEGHAIHLNVDGSAPNACLSEAEMAAREHRMGMWNGSGRTRSRGQ